MAESALEAELKKYPKVKFVKYHFADLQGNVREKTRSREDVKEKGITTTDGSSIFGKIIPPTESDMLLYPDPSTLVVVPWAEDTGRVLCNVYTPSAEEGKPDRPFEGCSRNILKDVEESMASVLTTLVRKRCGKKKIQKFHAHMSPEVEFLLVKEGYDAGKIHLDQNLANNNYFVPPKEIVDNALKDMMRSLSKVSLKREIYHTEVTTYQCEIGIAYGNALAMADAVMTLKYIIGKIAEKHGLVASFIPKFRKGVNGSGMHVHQNLAVTMGGKEENLFYDPVNKDALSAIGRHYIAGLLAYAREITAITNAWPISYKRLVPGAEAPTYIAWDWQNRTALCRGHSQGKKSIRIEYRAPDPMCNPYLAFSAMLAAGLEGIEQRLKLPQPEKRDFYHDNSGVQELPGNLGEALDLMNQSRMLRKRLGDFIVDTLYKLGKDSWREYNQEVSDVDIRRYF